MFRALTCPSSGGKIVFTQHLVSSLSVNVCTVYWLKASDRSQPVYCADVYRERRYQMLCEFNFPPEDGHVNARNMSRIIVYSVTNIFIMNKENCALKLFDEITLCWSVLSVLILTF